MEGTSERHPILLSNSGPSNEAPTANIFWRCGWAIALHSWYSEPHVMLPTLRHCCFNDEPNVSQPPGRRVSVWSGTQIPIARPTAGSQFQPTSKRCSLISWLPKSQPSQCYTPTKASMLLASAQAPLQTQLQGALYRRCSFTQSPVSLHCLPATQHNCFCQPSKPKSPRRVWGHRRPQVPKPSRGCLEFQWLLETSKGQAWRTGVTVPRMCHNGTGVIQTWHVCSQLEPMDTVSLGDPTGQLCTSLFLWDRGRVVSATRPSSWF